MSVIRDFAKDDLEPVTTLIREVLAEFDFPFASTFAGLFPHEAFWVAELDGEIVGTVAIRPKEGRTCELKRLYVRSSARGHGVGRALYLHAEEFARAAGYERIWLDSSRRFVQARRLYEKMGFVLLEELDNGWEDNVYEKRLGPA